jgi:hypothetical protein
MNFKIVAVALAALATFAHAQPSSFLVEALQKGSASAPLPAEGPFKSGVSAIESRTGHQGSVEILAWRIERFTQQANCGRVGFIPHQPASKTAFPEMGGELNICDDGMPPLRFCAALGLVPFSARCPDGASPQDTDEVKAAIAAALTRGGLSQQQVARKIQEIRGLKK